MVENLINGYAPKRVEAKIPILSFYALKKPRLSNDYTEEQKAAFDQFDRDVTEPFFRSLISEFQNQISSCKNRRDPRRTSLLFHRPGGTGL